MKHSWTRYWVRYGGTIQLDSGGFPVDPEDENARFYDLDARRLTDLDSIPVLVLLGEPGMGKSTVLEEEKERLEKAGEKTCYRPLNQYHTDDRLIKDIFETDDVKDRKTDEQSRLYLLLDSLDECQLSINNIVRILVNQLERLSRNRLYLRITCRIADWPTSFTDDLQRLWPKAKDSSTDPVLQMELIPLRRVDIELAARDHSLNADTFLEEVRRQAIQPFAYHPHTLNMLLEIFGKGGVLPARRTEIFQQGCLRLATELNTFRCEADFKGNLSRQQRLRVAGRIAAQLLFAQRTAIIWQAQEWKSEPDDLNLSDITGEIEQANGLKFPVDAKAVQEVLNTSLFTGRGPSRLGFTHQTYMEFLAAWYLKACDLDVGRILRLIYHQDDRRIPPQLAETAAWLAALIPDVFTALVDVEPLILLRADLIDVIDPEKERLTAALLNSYANHTAFDSDWGLRTHYPKLAYPGLVEQLRRWINNKNTTLSARRAAIDIAEACEVKDLAMDLAAVALDAQDDYRHRVNAAAAVVELADDSVMAKLRPLAFANTEDDPEGRLKAEIIPALWPRHLSTQELFDLITQSDSVGLLGHYQYTVDKFVGQISLADLTVALQWIRDSGKLQDEYFKSKLKDALMAHGWMLLEEPGILPAFAEAAWACYQRYEPLFNRKGNREKTHPFTIDHDKRHALLKALLSKIATSEQKVFMLVRHQDLLLMPMDIPWILEQYQATENQIERSALARCITVFFSWGLESSLMDCVVKVADADALNAPLVEAVTRWMEPVWLDSEEANKQREAYYKLRELEHHPPNPLDPPPAQRVEEALTEFESGKQDAWMRLWGELTLEDKATHYQVDIKSITDLPGWERASQQDRVRILCCAEGWLNSERLSANELFPPERCIDYRHIATCLALDLLVGQNPSFLVSAHTDYWENWAAAIVTGTFMPTSAVRVTLLQMAYISCPVTVIETFHRRIAREIENSEYLSAVQDLETLWDEKVKILLHEFQGRKELKPNQLGSILKTLLAHNDPVSFDSAIGLITTGAQEELMHQHEINAAKLLLEFATEKAWPVVWQKMTTDTNFGEQLMQSIAWIGSASRQNFLSNLTETQLADLFIWLETRFPAAEDTRYPQGDFHEVTRRDEVAQLRNACVPQITQRGTAAAVSAMENLCQLNPAREWLKFQLSEARQAARRATWQPIGPRDLLTLTRRRDGRLVRSGTELLDAVLESLQRLQDKLHGETPLAPFLWNLDQGEKTGRPKSEDRLSDFVLYHLQQDLPTLVINREVQVRNLEEHGIGERTDLKIEATSQQGKPLVVIIETKGCWNHELETAMQNQLRDRYMIPTHANGGIYLVGWFYCDRWRNSPRKHESQKADNKEVLQKRLEEQAQSLSNHSVQIRSFVLDATYPNGQAA